MSVSSERAYLHIRSAILSGRYPSGARLPEDMIASELGLSRTPIRDALRRLQVEQLVAVTPYSGARVAHWMADELSELAEMRAMLEGFVARLAAVKRAPHHLATMAELCDRMEAEAALPHPDFDRMTTDNLAFHHTVASAADNARAMACLEPLWNLPLRARPYGRFGPERLHRSLAHHREILSAIEKRDPAWADSVMRTHVLAARALDGPLPADGPGMNEPAVVEAPVAEEQAPGE